MEIVFDRRHGERRQRTALVPAERRQRERRVRNLSYDLDRLGYALVRRLP